MDPEDLYALANQLAMVAGRIANVIILRGAEVPSNLLGAPGSAAFNADTRTWYGPKDEVTGWPPGVSVTTGPTGDTGPSGTITGITVTTGAAGSQAAIVLGGTPQARTLALTLPRGDTGNTGATPALSIGTVTTGAAGSSAAASLSGTALAPVLALTIPRGNAGVDATITGATVVTGAPGSAVAIVVGGTAGARTFQFTIPRGDVGATPAISIGTVTTGAAGSAVAVTVGGTAAAPVLNFTIPRGDTGATPALSIGTITTGAAGSAASATFGGTAAAPILNLTIPRGDPGLSGSGTGDVLGPATNIADYVPQWNGPNSKTLKQGRAIGAASTTDLLDRAAGDARFRPISYVPAFAELTGKPVTLAGYGITDAAPASALAGKADLVGGLIPTSQLPALAITDVFEVASQALMLALTAETGDVAIRTDENKSYVLGSSPASTLANWKLLRTPTDVVLSVAGLTGAITAAALIAAIGVPAKATGTDLRLMVDDAKFLTAKAVADAAAIVTLTQAATIAVDLASGSNFVTTMTGNRTLGAPSNTTVGMTGSILIKQDATGGRTLAFNSVWKPFGSTPSLTTTPNAVDLLTFIVESVGSIRFSLSKGGAA